jgi:hypothetical protein
LPHEQAGLTNGHDKEEHRKESEPVRIISDPLRFKSEFLVNYRFFFAVTLGLLGLLFGVLSGKYFYRERYLVGAALIGCGWLCGLFALGGWLL